MAATDDPDDLGVTGVSGQDPVTNGHGFVPNVPKTAPSKKKTFDEEEEDPYEKIEIRKEADKKAKQQVQNQESESREKEDTLIVENEKVNNNVQREIEEKVSLKNEAFVDAASEKVNNLESSTEVSVTKTAVDIKSNKSDSSSKSKKKSNKTTSTEIKETEVSEIRPKNDSDTKESIEHSSQILIKVEETIPDTRDSHNDKEKEISATKCLPSSSGKCIHDVPVNEPCEICFNNIERVNLLSSNAVKSSNHEIPAKDKINTPKEINSDEAVIKKNLGYENIVEAQDNSKLTSDIEKSKDLNNDQTSETQQMSEKENGISTERVKNEITEINSSTLKSESIENTVMHKPPVQTKDKRQRKARSKSRDKERKKTQEFNNQELEALRKNFAQTQGVKEVHMEPFKPLNTEEKIKEDVNIELNGTVDIEEDRSETQVEKTVKKSAEESLY